MLYRSSSRKKRSETHHKHMCFTSPHRLSTCIDLLLFVRSNMLQWLWMCPRIIKPPSPLGWRWWCCFQCWLSIFEPKITLTLFLLLPLLWVVPKIKVCKKKEHKGKRMACYKFYSISRYNRCGLIQILTHNKQPAKASSVIENVMNYSLNAD